MNLAGVFAPIPTPFDDRDRVDTTRLKAALAKWVTKPLAGFVVLGSNGEGALMDDFESDQAIVAARDAVPPGKGFIVGTGRESTQATIKATRRAAEQGADAVLVRTPGFFKSQMTNDVFVRHYTALAGARASLQFHRRDRRQPAAGSRRASGDAPEHRRHEGVGRRRRAGRGSGVADARRLHRARRRRRDAVSDDVRRR